MPTQQTSSQEFKDNAGVIRSKCRTGSSVPFVRGAYESSLVRSQVQKNAVDFAIVDDFDDIVIRVKCSSKVYDVWCRAPRPDTLAIVGPVGEPFLDRSGNMLTDASFSDDEEPLPQRAKVYLSPFEDTVHPAVLQRMQTFCQVNGLRCRRALRREVYTVSLYDLRLIIGSVYINRPLRGDPDYHLAALTNTVISYPMLSGYHIAELPQRILQRKGLSNVRVLLDGYVGTLGVRGLDEGLMPLGCTPISLAPFKYPELLDNNLPSLIHINGDVYLDLENDSYLRTKLYGPLRKSRMFGRLRVVW